MSSPKAMKSGTTEEPNWTKTKKSIRPSVEPMRDMGAESTPNGTFGMAPRFSDKLVGSGACSPNGKEYFKRSALFKNEYLEHVRHTSQGIGARPVPSQGMTPAPSGVGPGSYMYVVSRNHPVSPLDGREFCKTTMHAMLKSTLIPSESCSPGPHHKYQIARDINEHCAKYDCAKPLLKQNKRHSFKEDTDQPGPGEYDVLYFSSVASSASSPNLGRAAKGSVEKMRYVKSTFGMSKR